MTPDAAYDEYDRVMDLDAANAAELLAMSKQEWTAFLHGALFQEIAAWRYDGWPTTCAICGEPLDAAGTGWFAREMQPEKHSLVHIECIPPHPNNTD